MIRRGHVVGQCNSANVKMYMYDIKAEMISKRIHSKLSVNQDREDL